MDGYVNSIVESMLCHIGRTVTIFTTSGGFSGAGFTGVLLCVDCNVVKLLCDFGAPPACPIGSSCTTSFSPWGGNNGGGNDFPCGNPLGAVCVIPTCAIACFTHNAI